MLRTSFAVLTTLAVAANLFAQSKTDLNGDPLPDRAIARIGSARFRHPGPLQAVAISPDGKLIAAASASPSLVRIWNRADGKLLDQWRFPEQSPPEQLLFSPDSTRLLAGRFSERAKPWSVWVVARRTGADVGPEGERSIPFHSLAPDGRHATLVSGEQILCWDLITDKQVGSFKRPDRQIVDCAIVGDAGWVALSHNGTHYVATRLKDDKQLWSIEGDWDGVLPNQLSCFSPDGKRLALHTSRGCIKSLDGVSGKELSQVKTDTGGVIAMRLSPDGSALAVSWRSTGVRVYELAKGERRTQLAATSGNPVSMAFSADSRTLATVDPDGAKTILFFDAARGTPVDSYVGHTSPIVKVAMSPDGTKVATAGDSGTEPLLGVWDATNGKQLWVANEARVSDLAFSPDSELLATPIRLKGHPVRLWEAKSGRTVFDFNSGENPGGTLAFTRNGHLVGAIDRRVQLWDVRERKTIGETIHVPRGIDRIAVSPDGKQAIVGTPEAFSCEFGTRQSKGPVIPFGKYLTGFSLSPDGRLLATADGGKSVRLWEVLTWFEAMTIELRDTVHAVAYSPVGHTLAIATDGGTILYHLPTKAIRATLQPGPFPDTLVAFSADGRRLVTAGNHESTATVWDVSVFRSPPENKKTARIDLDDCWNDLASADPKFGYSAAWKLVVSADEAIPHIAAALTKSVPAAKVISQLIADLDSRRYAIREKATRELMAAGDKAVGALREARKGKVSAEQLERIDELLKKLDGPTLPPTRLRTSRAIAVLELIANDKAKAVLEELARGPENALLTQEAKSALARWK